MSEQPPGDDVASDPAVQRARLTEPTVGMTDATETSRGVAAELTQSEWRTLYRLIIKHVSSHGFQQWDSFALPLPGTSNRLYVHWGMQPPYGRQHDAYPLVDPATGELAAGQTDGAPRVPEGADRGVDEKPLAQLKVISKPAPTPTEADRQALLAQLHSLGLTRRQSPALAEGSSRPAAVEGEDWRPSPHRHGPA